MLASYRWPPCCQLAICTGAAGGLRAWGGELGGLRPCTSRLPDCPMPTSSPEALVSVSCHGTPSQPSKGTLQPSNAWILVCIVGTHPMLFVTLDLLWAPGIVDPPYYSLRDIVVPKTLRDQLCSFSKHISVLCHPVLNAHSPTRSPP